MRIEQKIANTLIRQRKTLAIAESCTGGLLTHRLTNIPGSSNFLQLGIIAYSNEAKIRCLKVPQNMLKRHGAVNQKAAVAMAKGIRRILRTDFGIGITGIAGPTGATKKKPIGLTFIAICGGYETTCLKCQFKGDRESIKSQAATQTLKLLLEFLDE